MEGFSALCFRLHVAQKVAGGDGKSGSNGGGVGESSNNNEEQSRATASITASNKSDKGISPKFGKKRRMVGGGGMNENDAMCYVT
eukprot:scaffold7562_cov81-Skeletonema_marinoi.AAC.2